VTSLTPLLVYAFLFVKKGGKPNNKINVSLKKTQPRISFVLRIIKVGYLIFYRSSYVELAGSE
jgi:hypothetical protein